MNIKLLSVSECYVFISLLNDVIIIIVIIDVNINNSSCDAAVPGKQIITNSGF